MDEIKSFEPLFGTWYVDKLIGEGSFGKVYKVRREEMGTTYYAALKHISVPSSPKEIDALMQDGMDIESILSYYSELVKSINEENRIMDSLKGNTNIVSYESSRVIKKTDSIGYDIFIRMELLTSLTKSLQEKPMNRKDVIKLGIDMCNALEICSRSNIIHRDIKLDNIFVNSYGDYKLGDFGIARILDENGASMSKKGTYSYMAPEVYKGENYGASVDIYSLGMVMYRLTNAGRLPFLPPAPEPISPDDRENSLVRRMMGEEMSMPCNADPALGSIILKACSYTPADRFSSPKEMRQALENLTRQEEASAYIINDPLYQTPSGNVINPTLVQYGEMYAQDMPIYIDPSINPYNGLSAAPNTSIGQSSNIYNPGIDRSYNTYPPYSDMYDDNMGSYDIKNNGWHDYNEHSDNGIEQMSSTDDESRRSGPTTVAVIILVVCVIIFLILVLPICNVNGRHQSILVSIFEGGAEESEEPIDIPISTDPESPSSNPTESVSSYTPELSVEPIFSATAPPSDPIPIPSIEEDDGKQWSEWSYDRPDKPSDKVRYKYREIIESTMFKTKDPYERDLYIDEDYVVYNTESSQELVYDWQVEPIDKVYGLSVENQDVLTSDGEYVTMYRAFRDVTIYYLGKWGDWSEIQYGFPESDDNPAIEYKYSYQIN